MYEQQNPDYPFIAPELIPFIAPLRAKIQEHHDWLEERGYTYGIGDETEWRNRDFPVGDNPDKKLYDISEALDQLYLRNGTSGQYFGKDSWWRYGVTLRGDKNPVVETRALHLESGMSVCDNAMSIHRDMVKACQTINQDLPEILGKHYHLHLLKQERGRKPIDCILPPELILFNLETVNLVAGLMGMIDMSLPFCRSLSYLSDSSGSTTKGISYGDDRETCLRHIPSGESKYDRIECRANLKGEDALPELAICRILGGIRWGLNPEKEKEMHHFFTNILSEGDRLPFVTSNKSWEDDCSHRLKLMQKNEAVLMCYGVEAVQGLTKYFERKLENFLSQQSTAAGIGSLQTVASTKYLAK